MGVLVVGMALLILGVALAGSALLYAIRLRTVIELDAESITIRRGSRQDLCCTARWTSVTRAG